MSNYDTENQATSQESEEDAPEQPAGKGKKGGGRKKSSITAKQIKRRASRILAMDDVKKARQSQRKLMRQVMEGIAEGTAASPKQCAAAFFAAFPKGTKLKEVAADDEADEGEGSGSATT